MIDKTKRVIAKNIVVNKHFYINVGIDEQKRKELCFQYTVCLKHEEADLSKIKELGEITIECLIKRLKEREKDGIIKFYCFSLEKSENQKKESFHIQGYIEFVKKVDILAFNRKYQFSDIRARKGTKQQAKDYVEKKETKMSDKIYSFSLPFKTSSAKSETESSIVCDRDEENKTQKEKLLAVKNKLENNLYKTFNEIFKEHPSLSMCADARQTCKFFWDLHRHTTFDFSSVSLIWVYGPSGIGKSYWTDEYLTKKGFNKKTDICYKKASSWIRPKLWFNNCDEERPVLWIEEVRTNFPEYNDLIQLIDKKTALESKGGFVRNNFELIIINSLLSPWEVFNHLEYPIEILRRIYSGTILELVNYVGRNKNKFNKKIDRSKCLPGMLHEYLHLKGKIKCICCKKCLQNIEH